MGNIVGRVRLYSLSSLFPLPLLSPLSLSLTHASCGTVKYLEVVEMHGSYVSRPIMILQQLSAPMSENSPLAMVAH